MGQRRTEPSGAARRSSRPRLRHFLVLETIFAALVFAIPWLEHVPAANMLLALGLSLGIDWGIVSYHLTVHRGLWIERPFVVAGPIVFLPAGLLGLAIFAALHDEAFASFWMGLHSSISMLLAGVRGTTLPTTVRVTVNIARRSKRGAHRD